MVTLVIVDSQPVHRCPDQAVPHDPHDAYVGRDVCIRRMADLSPNPFVKGGLIRDQVYD